MNDLITKRNERTRERKKFKRKMDSIIGLSYHDADKKVMTLSANVSYVADKTARLLDEGYCDNGFVLKKGAVEKYLNGENQYVRGWEYNGIEWEQTEVLNLTDDFVGTVNMGHIDFATLPVVLGEFTRADLSVVDIENDRKALDVNVRLDEESMFVRELKRQNHDIGISAEFWAHTNEEDTRSLSEMLGYYMPVFDEIFIFAYGLVGECGNVNSSGLELKGETEMPKEIKELSVETPMEETANTVTEEENDVIELENDVIEDEAVEEPIEESIETDTEPEEEPNEESAEEPVDEEVEEPMEESFDNEEGEIEEEVEEDLDEDEADEVDLEEALSVINDLREQVTRLTSEVESLTEANAELKKSNKRLNKKLKAEMDKKKEFIKNAKGISMKLGVHEEKPKEDKNVIDAKYASGDGIGD